MALLMLIVLPVACDGSDEDPAATTTSLASVTAAPTEAAATTVALQPQATQTAREVKGLFLEPRPREPDRFVSVPTRPPSPFQSWDRRSVVLYDVEELTEVNFGAGYIPSVSPDDARLAFNVLEGNRPVAVRIVDIATKATLIEFEYTGGLASFIGDNHLYLPGGPGSAEAYDLRTGERTGIDDIDDPVLKARVEQRASGSPTLVESSHRLVREVYEDRQDRCSTDPSPAVPYELCQAERFETWRLDDVATGTPILAFRAYAAGPAGPGELVIATSPQCPAGDGRLLWCAEPHLEVRDSHPAQRPYEEVHGTTNIFIVDIESGEAEFVATASFSATTAYSWPQNWPLIADERYAVWTGSYCSQEEPENTMIYDRTTGELTALDQSLWVQFTPLGDLGVDPFGPKAILDIETLDWKVVLPEEVTDVGESPDGRYLMVGGVLGHGGLC